MGDEVCCTRQETIPDIKFIYPEQNMSANNNQKNEESFDNQDELNIIEQIKTNKYSNNIGQKNTNSVIIQNDEFMYERINTKKNKIENDNIIEDKEGPQDSIKITENENNFNHKRIESDFPEDSNIISSNKENHYDNIVIDENKIIISYQPINIENNNDNEEDNFISDNNNINDNEYNNEENNINDNNNIMIDNQYNEEKNIEQQNQEMIDNNINEDINYNNDKFLIEKENEIKTDDNIIQYNTENIIPNNNSIFQNVNYTQENDIKNSDKNIIYPEKETNQIQYEENNIIDNNISDNNNIIDNNNNNILLNEINLNENPTFFPKSNNKVINDNILFNIDNINITSNDINNNNQILIQNYEQTNNTNYDSKDFTNIISNISSNTYNPSITNNTYDYLLNNTNKEKPLFTDKEIDDMIKQAEQTYNVNNYYKNNYLINNNYRVATPEKKITSYPLTPDYQIRKNENYNDIFDYNINSYTEHYTNIGNNNNVNYINNYTPIIYPQKQVKKNLTNYYQYINYDDYNIKYESQKRTQKNNQHILYSTPTKENYNLNYILSPPKNQTRQVIVQNPIKVNPPIIQYNNYNTTQIKNTKPLVYNTLGNTSVINNYNYSTPVDTNIYQPKKIANNSIINKSYLKSIQQMNQNNDVVLLNNKKTYNVNSLSSSNLNNLNSSISSSSSLRKLDKKGNPIYITSLRSDKDKLKQYHNYKRDKRSDNKYRSFSDDDISSRRNRLEDEFSNDVSSYKSPFSSPKNENNINFDLNSMGSINSLNSFKNNNIKYINRNNINNKSIIPTIGGGIKNSTIAKSIKDDLLSDIDEPTKQIIKKYSSLDLSSTSNFYPDNYKLFFYSSSPNFSVISNSQIYTKKRIKYYINNDPSREAIYTGAINFLNQRHGLGQLKEPNCTKIGNWKNGIFSGWGRIIYNNGQVFEGKYENGKLNGKGVYKYKDVLYVGDFMNNSRQGKGVLITKNFRYNGQFNNGKIDGYGKIIFYQGKEDEGEYEGFFKNNNIEGKGTMKWKNGNMYIGEMKNGKMNGSGKFIPYGGIPIEGIFRNNVKVNIKK